MKLFIINLFLIIVFFPSITLAEVDCPFGIVDDSYPGDCSRYVDVNGNYTCDLSELKSPADDKSRIDNLDFNISEEDLKNMTVRQTAEFYGVDELRLSVALSDFLKKPVNGTDSMLKLHDSSGLCMGVAASIASSLNKNPGTDSVELNEYELITGRELKIKTVEEVAELYGIDKNKFSDSLANKYNIDINPKISMTLLHDNAGVEMEEVKKIASNLITSSKIEQTTNNTANHKRYKFGLIFSTTIILYVMTWLLARFKKITLLTHRRIWNTILLFTFLVSGIFGLALVLRINYGLFLRLPFNMLYLHVEAGTVMAIVSFFHITWHWKYFAIMLKKRKINS